MASSTFAADGITEMSIEECWELLGRNEFGHLAFTLLDEVHLVPLNFISDGSRLVFRTSEGSKLLGMTMDSRVAFEVDEIGRAVARTVIVHGRARRLHGQEEEIAEQLPLRPWSASLKYNVVEIQPTDISGRVFELER